MKKTTIICILLALALCLTLASCAETAIDGSTEIIKSLRIVESSPRSFAIDEDLNLTDVKIEVEYKSGKKDIVSLSETMLSDKDRPKFSTVGAGITVLINYGGRTIPFSFEVISSRTVSFYYVHFESNQGTKVASQFVSVLETLTIPTRTGYTFLGWYDNVDLRGNPAKAPLTITKETTFFAKWKDNRTWEVKFLDKNGVVIPGFTQTVTHGESVLSRPTAPAVEGYAFNRWDGQFDNITESTYIRAVYEQIFCTVTYYTSLENNEKEQRLVAYGEPLPEASRPQFIEQTGHTGRWKILTINNEKVEIVDQLDRITSNIDIIPVYEIIKFKVTFMDDSAFEGTGTSWQSIIKTVDYDSDLSLTAGENASIITPQPRTGYLADWAVRIDNEWVCLTNGSQWDESNSEWIPLDIPATVLELKSASSGVISVITNGTHFQNIKGDINVQAKYVKTKHTLIFKRSSETLETVQSIAYGTKFKLYLADAPQQGFVYGDKTKTYYVNHNAADDWDVEWYPNMNYEVTEKVDLENGYLTVTGDRTLYCKDIDLRVYEVQFYDWDFKNSMSVLKTVGIVQGGEIIYMDTQTVPHGGDAAAPVLNNQLEYGYELIDARNYWFDAPQDAGYARQIYINGITADTKFYARYKIKSFSITFRDYFYPYDDNGNAEDLAAARPLPEVTYYKNESGGDLPTGYLRMDAVYIRSFGHQFSVSEIYFGGDGIYEKKSFIDQYLTDLAVYNALLPDYGTLKNKVAEYEGYLQEIALYEAAKLAYTVTPELQERYDLLAPQKDFYRRELYNASQDLSFIIDYKIRYYQEGDPRPTGAEVGDEDKTSGAREREYLRLLYGQRDSSGAYVKENGEYVLLTDVHGNLIDNGDYARFVNLYYKTTDRIGYEFDGWYTSPNFNVSTKVSLDDIQTVDINANLILYAKWVDLEKGSDGLVFEKLSMPNPDYTPENGEDELLYYFQVIDYISQPQWNDKYSIVIDGGHTYYEFVDASETLRRVPAENISRNTLPENSTDLDSSVKIPSTHQSQYLQVKRIVTGLFGANNDVVLEIDIPISVQWIDEGAFSDCFNLGNITKATENIYFSVEKGVLYTADGSVLICYPAQLRIEEYEYGVGDAVVPASTFIVNGGVLRIAESAFNGCSHLRYIAIEESAHELVIADRAFSGITGLISIGKPASSAVPGGGNVCVSDGILPDRLVSIGAFAFQGCHEIVSVEATVNSHLTYVGASAFSDTSWYLQMKAVDAKYVNGTASGGIIMLGYVALGTTSDYTGTQINLHAADARAIADGAFKGLITLTKVVLLNPAFQYIGKEAFMGCLTLSEFEVMNGDPESCVLGLAAFQSAGTTQFSIYVPSEAVQDYKEAVGWDEHADKITSRI